MPRQRRGFWSWYTLLILGYRRDRADMIQIYKSVYGHDELKWDHLFTLSSGDLRGHHLKFVKKKSKHNSRLYSFSQRSVIRDENGWRPKSLKYLQGFQGAALGPWWVQGKALVGGQGGRSPPKLLVYKHLRWSWLSQNELFLTLFRSLYTFISILEKSQLLWYIRFTPWMIYTPMTFLV